MVLLLWADLQQHWLQIPKLNLRLLGMQLLGLVGMLFQLLLSSVKSRL